MSKYYDFIRECGVFYVLSVDGDAPAGRPFGAIAEYGDTLYITTGAGKAVCQQLMKNPNIQLLALKAGTRNWLRLSGKASICTDPSVKARILEDIPMLKKRFGSANDSQFVAIAITDISACLNDDGTITVLHQEK